MIVETPGVPDFTVTEHDPAAVVQVVAEKASVTPRELEKVTTMPDAPSDVVAVITESAIMFAVTEDGNADTDRVLGGVTVNIWVVQLLDSFDSETKPVTSAQMWNRWVPAAAVQALGHVSSSVPLTARMPVD